MASPPQVIVEHATAAPAADCAVASLLAARIARGAERPVLLTRLRDPAAAFAQPESAEHVLAEGRLADNSLLWPERVTASRVRFLETAAPPEATAEPLVIAFNPVLAPRLAVSDMARRLEPAPLRLRVAEDRDGLAVRCAEEDESDRTVARGERDRYGRWRLLDRGLSALLAEGFGLAAPPESPPATPGDGTPAPRLVVVGEPPHFHEVFPAVAAALGDAADAEAMRAEIAFVSPYDLEPPAWAARLAAADGLVLPGGSDLGQAEGQIAAATAALTAGLPTVGLCLGMQTMTAAVARAAAGLPTAGLEEADPDGSCLLFRRLRDEAGRPRHRLGEARVRIVPGSRLAACCREGTLRERLNHRYALSDAYTATLEAAGLRICARSQEGTIADAVEHAGHPFFIGLQSHPELSSRAGAPHPALRGFLRAAADYSPVGSG